MLPQFVVGSSQFSKNHYNNLLRGWWPLRLEDFVNIKDSHRLRDVAGMAGSNTSEKELS